MSGRLILPYENSDWRKWEKVLRMRIKDSADFDEVMTLLHGDKYTPQAFSSLLFNYFKDEDPTQIINPRPENRKIDKEALFSEIIPFIRDMARKCPELFYSYILQKKKINPALISTLTQEMVIEKLVGEEEFLLTPLSIAGENRGIMITRQHCVALLACAFFGLFDLYDPYDINGVGGANGAGTSAKIGARTDFAGLNLTKIITSQNITAFECLINYFNRVRTTVPTGNIIIKRINSVDGKNANALWSKNSPLSPVRIYTNMLAEVSASQVQLVPFDGAFTQFDVSKKNEMDAQTVNYLIRPELLLLPLFVGNLKQNESLAVLGAETFSTVINSQTGPGMHVLKFSGDFYDRVQRVHNGTPARTLLFINDRSHEGVDGSYLENFKPTLNALAGCMLETMPKRDPNDVVKRVIDISTGPWGAQETEFGGELRFLQLLIACSSIGGVRINFHNNDMAETVRRNQIAGDSYLRIVDFINYLEKKNAGMGRLINSYNEFLVDLRRDRENNYGEYNLKKISIFHELKNRI